MTLAVGGAFSPQDKHILYHQTFRLSNILIFCHFNVFTVIDNIESSQYRSQTVVVDLCHRFTVIHMNEMNVFDQ